MTAAEMQLAHWRRTRGVASGVVRDDEKEPERPAKEGVKEEVRELAERREDRAERRDATAQTTGQGEEVPAWAAAFMQRVDARLDEIEKKTKGGVPGVEDGQEGTERVERTAVAKDAMGEPAESAANGPEAARKFAEAERAETRGEAQFAGQGLSPVTASEEEQQRLQRSREAGPERSERDPRLEDGVDRFNTQGQRRDGERREDRSERREDYRGHGTDKTSHHSVDRMDGLIKQQAHRIDELTALVTKATRQPSIEDRNAIARARSRADGVYAALGRELPEYLPGEAPMAYRHRLADGLKDTSASLKRTVMDQLPDDVFGHIEDQVYNDAFEASKRPDAVAPMRLRPRAYKDEATGHNITEYYGDPLGWMAPFMAPGARSKVHRPTKTVQ